MCWEVKKLNRAILITQPRMIQIILTLVGIVSQIEIQNSIPYHQRAELIYFVLIKYSRCARLFHLKDLIGESLNQKRCKKLMVSSHFVWELKF